MEVLLKKPQSVNKVNEYEERFKLLTYAYTQAKAASQPGKQREVVRSIDRLLDKYNASK